MKHKINKKTLLLTTLTILIASSTQAKVQPLAETGLELGLGYGVVKAEMPTSDGPTTLTNQMATLSVGYRFKNPDGAFSIMPRASIGQQTSTDDLHSTMLEVDDNMFGGQGHYFEIERMTSLELVLQLHTTDTFFVYLSPAYTRTDIKIDGPDTTLIDDTSDWNFGFGAGAGMYVNDKVSLRASCMRLNNDREHYGLAIQYHF
jgi:opacity protein-like surface antigen